jgi:outer membrane receptor protein involved in Fe transport
MDVYYGSGFSNGEGPPSHLPSHLPSHAEVNVAAGKSFMHSLSASVTVLNLTDRHLLVDNSLTFGGFHYNNPREIYAQLRYRF